MLILFPLEESLLAEIHAFHEQQKGNADLIQKLGHVEYRMWTFIERIVAQKTTKPKEGK